MDKRPQRLAKNKTDLMPKNASCKRWDTLHFPRPRSGLVGREHDRLRFGLEEVWGVGPEFDD
jgi:hypothetical protein